MKSAVDVAVIIGGEVDGPLGFKTVGTVSTVSNQCGLFNSTLPDLPKGKKSASAAFLDSRYFHLSNSNIIFRNFRIMRFDVCLYKTNFDYLGYMFVGATMF